MWSGWQGVKLEQEDNIHRSILYALPYHRPLASTAEGTYRNPAKLYSLSFQVEAASSRVKAAAFHTKRVSSGQNVFRNHVSFRILQSTSCTTLLQTRPQPLSYHNKSVIYRKSPSPSPHVCAADICAAWGVENPRWFDYNISRGPPFLASPKGQKREIPTTNDHCYQVSKNHSSFLSRSLLLLGTEGWKGFSIQ